MSKLGNQPPDMGALGDWESPVTARPTYANKRHAKHEQDPIASAPDSRADGVVRLGWAVMKQAFVDLQSGNAELRASAYEWLMRPRKPGEGVLTNGAFLCEPLAEYLDLDPDFVREKTKQIFFGKRQVPVFMAAWERRRQILELREQHPDMKQKEIAAAVGVTHQRVHQILSEYDGRRGSY